MAELTLQQAFDLALQHHQAGNFPAAEPIYRQILAQLPDEPQVLHMLGLLMHQTARNDLAVELITRAIQHNPADAASRSNLGLVLFGMDRTEEAIASFRESLALDASIPETHNNLGNALHRRGDFAAAEEAYRRATQLRPGFITALVNHAGVLRETGRLDEAIDAYETIFKLDPNHQQALINAGNAMKDVARLDDAMERFERALRLRPDNELAHSSSIYLQYFLPQCSAEMIRNSEAEFEARFGASLRPRQPPIPTDRDPDRTLRIGYVSGDFYDHVVARNLLPLLKQHDRERFHITCYSNGRRSDAISAQFQSLADQWRSIVNLSDDAAANLIRADAIDILVDLSLHLGGNRLLVFARKPAPVQITFAGYPGSTGLRAIDYRLTDPYLDPPGTDHLYSEKSIRLPHSFWCYDPLGDAPPINELPARANGLITFGCLNNFCKLNEAVLQLWRRVMVAVPNSRLLILAAPGRHREWVVDVLGIDRNRVQFVEPRPRAEYLKLYHQIDITLDTFPYNGHTTSLDGLYMGVPTITLRGQTIAGRAGVSQLSNLGLTELIAESQDQYVDIAKSLSGDTPRLAELRSALRQRMERSPLMDAKQFAAGIEAAYERAWKSALASCD